MRLDKYIKEYGIKKGWFAKQLGVSRVYLNHLIEGKYTCTPELGKKIAEATGGKVTREEIPSYKMVKIEE